MPPTPDNPQDIGDKEVILAAFKNRREELMRYAVLPICISWTHDVPEYATHAAMEGVRDVIQAIGEERQVIAIGSRAIPPLHYPGADALVQQALNTQQIHRDKGYGPQLIMDHLKPLLHAQPWLALPHWDMFIVNNDVTGYADKRLINWAFGATYYGQNNEYHPMSIQSVTRIIQSSQDPQLRSQMIRQIIRHEYGHMYGLPDLVGTIYNLPKRTAHLVDRLGTHCANPCSMQQVMTVAELKQQAKYLADPNHPLFCNDCLLELQRVIDVTLLLPDEALALYRDMSATT